MNSVLAPWVNWLIRCTLPAASRDVVMGDLIEEAHAGGPLVSPLRQARAVLGYAVFSHVEPYRDRDSRAGPLALMVIGLTALWAIRLATQSANPDPSIYGDPFSKRALAALQASHITSACAAGLLVGHAPWVPSFAAHARWHVVGVLMGVCVWITPGLSQAILSAAALASAAWLADRGRNDEPEPQGS